LRRWTALRSAENPNFKNTRSSQKRRTRVSDPNRAGQKIRASRLARVAGRHPILSTGTAFL